MDFQSQPKTTNPILRIRIWYALLLVLSTLFVIRLFYLQIIRHDHYQAAALSGQLKEYEIPAERGVIAAQSGGEVVPIVLNQIRYTLFADPVYIKDPEDAAKALSRLTGGDAHEYEEKLRRDDTRYVVLARRLDKSVSEKIEALEIKGVGTREVPERAYPQGQLAAQLLGFVNNDGEGKYGIEQALDEVLRGQPGQLKAITDARGVPLAANQDNVNIEPKSGDRITLTIDIGMQASLEDILKAGVERARSEFGSALIIEAKTGAIKAIANYPTYNPADFSNVEDASLFNNAAVSRPLEPGSIMKPLTVAAAVDQGVVSKDTTYYDPGQWKVDDATIQNVEEVRGSGTRSMGDILQKSLNTGATWLLMQMGGGEINRQARERWHDYMKRYNFGEKTGIEQGFEAAGVIPHPTKGYGLNIQFANSAFGQGMTATPLQMGAALAAAVNGGTYYQPRLVDATENEDGRQASTPKALRQVISPAASAAVRELMAYGFSQNHRAYGMAGVPAEFTIGGKTGTAQVPSPSGGYYEDRFNGMFMGFVGGNEAEYVIVTRVDEPKIGGYAGTTATGPVFVGLAEMLINNFGVRPKTN